MRVTRLDGCGRPQFGACSQVVSEGFISVGLSAVVNEGEAITVTNAAGKTCISDQACAEFGGYTVEMTFCDVDPDLFALLSGQEKVLDSKGDAVGFRMSQDVSGCDSGFALEVWAGVPGQACSDDPNAQGAYGYILLPFVQGGVLGDFTIENAAINFSVTGAATKPGSSWNVGPYDVVLSGVANTPGPLATPIKRGDHLHVQYTEVAPPEGTDGCEPLLDPSHTALTSISVAAGADDLSMTATATLTPSTPALDVEPVAIYWGDGTSDYYDTANAVLEHVYATPGTYTVEARRGSSKVTGQVTVTAVTP
jgi:hypothetical protein